MKGIDLNRRDKGRIKKETSLKNLKSGHEYITQELAARSFCR
jgi:hypothetical protein